jgi:predicted enzyme related to lactoylglutathione lyase
MKRVTGIGGVFFRAKDPKALAAWYRQHLGIPVEDWGGAAFAWKSADNSEGVGTTVWNPFPADSTYIGSGTWMVNYRVADLRALLAVLRDEGCAVDDKVEESEYGKFGWVTDPEGNRIELWQPPAGS